MTWNSEMSMNMDLPPPILPQMPANAVSAESSAGTLASDQSESNISSTSIQNGMNNHKQSAPQYGVGMMNNITKVDPSGSDIQHDQYSNCNTNRNASQIINSLRFHFMYHNSPLFVLHFSVPENLLLSKAHLKHGKEIIERLITPYPIYTEIVIRVQRLMT